MTAEIIQFIAENRTIIIVAAAIIAIAMYILFAYMVYSGKIESPAYVSLVVFLLIISLMMLIIAGISEIYRPDDFNEKNQNHIQTCINSDGQWINRRCYKKTN